MKSIFNEETIKDLEQYNIMKLLESANLGNLARGANWAASRLSRLANRISKFSDIEPRVDKDKD
ncbi:hypothetical protein ACFL6Y_08230 [Elusimicrobiota bacterium]